MALAVHLYYTGKSGSARRFAEEMLSSGTVARIRAEKGNLQYDYFYPAEDPETVLLLDCWENEEALEYHHASPMMQTILALREKYDLHMRVERYASENTHDPSADRFIRK